MLSPSQSRVAWVLQIIAAIIMGQTLFFKFTGAPEPVYIFTTLGAEPFGRWFAGASELVAVVLLLIPSHRRAGGAVQYRGDERGHPRASYQTGHRGAG